MLHHLDTLPADPILGLVAACREDPNPNKVDLTVGIYMNDEGLCPVFDAIRKAQDALIQEETTKAYMPADGDALFNSGIRRLVLGEDSVPLAEGRVSSLQTTGGCGALRIGAEVIRSANAGATVWVSDPTWPIHMPLLGNVGLPFAHYRYYDAAGHRVDFDHMVMDLQRAEAGDVVLLHACCHNPCGADLTLEQWGMIADMAERQGFVPFVDIAYQGMADDLQADAAGLRLLADRLPELIIASSCSKNMGLYRERTGAALFVCDSVQAAEAVQSQARTAARRLYSMPPAHGAILAGRVLAEADLRANWEAELAGMCARINGLRRQLRAELERQCGGDFAFVERERGMFSFLGLSEAQAQRLRQEYSVYMLDSSRINVAGVNADNLEYVATAVASVV
ncbi:MAG: amino acid aminotransferase [Pseudomonadota bacterium]